MTILPAISMVAAALASLQSAPSQDAAPELEAAAICQEAGYQRLDFMIGKWTVTDTRNGRTFGTSVIRSVQNGCAIREDMDFTPSGPLIEVVSRFDPVEGAWTQVWFGIAPTHVRTVEAQTEGTVSFEGKTDNMSNPAQDSFIRMTYTRGGNGSFRHQAYVSRDGGAEWRPSIDITYSRQEGTQ